jgi:hypothetical protein
MAATGPGAAAAPTWRPTAAQALVLQACLLPEAPAQAAFRAWAALAEPELHTTEPLAEPPAQSLLSDAATRRLLPLLWSRWRQWPHSGDAAAADAVVAGILPEVKRTWLENHRRLKAANALAEQLAAAGVPVMLVKGLPLALQAYGDLGLRPMGDFDLVVPLAQVQPALQVLAAAGWHPLPTPLKHSSHEDGEALLPPWALQPRPLEAFDAPFLQVRHSHGFHHASGLEADLHWFVFQGQCDPGVDDGLWHRAIALATVNRAPGSQPSPLLLVPDPADHLLLLLSHAARWDAVPAVRWLADAALLLRVAPTLDWDRLRQEARRRRLAALVAPMLALLREQAQAAVPPDLVRELAAVCLSRRERLLAPVQPGSPDWRGGVEELRYLHRRWRQLRRRAAAGTPLPAFHRFACHVLGAPDLRAFHAYALAELKRRLGWR